MSGDGAPSIEIPNSHGARVAIVASSWHQEIMASLIAGAERACAEAGATSTVLHVPGSFELPIVCQKVAPRHEAVVALGVVIRGGTPHFEYVCQGVTDGLMRVSLETSTPVGFGVLTCDTEEQAIARSGAPGSSEDKGYEAAAAALITHNAIAALT